MDKQTPAIAETPLRAIRRGRGWKYARDFAASVNVKYPTYTAHELGRQMSLEHAWLYADALEVTIDEIVGRVPFNPELKSIALKPLHGNQESIEQKSKAEECKQTIMECLDDIDLRGIECLRTVALSLRQASTFKGPKRKDDESDDL